MLAEYARALFKLAEALKQSYRTEEQTHRIREEAERLLRILKPDVAQEETGLETTYNSLVYIL
jgi:hypothetical protein